MRGLAIIALSASAVLGSAAAAAAAAPAAAIRTSPAEVRQGLGYRGMDVEVRAEAPAGLELLLRCLGPSKDVRLMRKGRVWGFWMNVGEVHLKDMPSLCLVAGPPGSADDEELGCRAAAGRAGGENDRLSEFVKLKQSEELYSVRETALRLEPVREGRASARAVFRLPAKAPTGEYTIELFARKGGRPVLLGERHLTVRMSGLPALLMRLLDRHPLLYGCFAVLFACVAGLAVGMVFGKSGH